MKISPVKFMYFVGFLVLLMTSSMISYSYYNADVLLFWLSIVLWLFAVVFLTVAPYLASIQSVFDTINKWFVELRCSTLTPANFDKLSEEVKSLRLDVSHIENSSKCVSPNEASQEFMKVDIESLKARTNKAAGIIQEYDVRIKKIEKDLSDVSVACRNILETVSLMQKVKKSHGKQS